MCEESFAQPVHRQVSKVGVNMLSATIGSGRCREDGDKPRVSTGTSDEIKGPLARVAGEPS